LLRIPVVAGYIKPIILFPVGIINQLQVDEVEAILAHEVAHLVRNDFVQNLVQSLIEMIFYYHPAVWWISAVVRSERENCCDDLAVQVCSNSLTYAKALVRLEDISYSAPALALPFAGSKGHLLNRIKRILNQPQNKSNVMERIVATLILIGCVTLLSFSERNAQAQKESKAMEVVADFQYETVDTVPAPAPREITVWKSVEGKEIEMRSENGEIKSLKIDGQEIDPAEYANYQTEIDRMHELAAATPPPPPAPPAPPTPPAFAFPEMAPMPPMPPMPEMPLMPAMPGMPEMAPMPPIPAIPEMPAREFDHLFFTPPPGTPHGSKKTTTIIREKDGNGYSYHVESDGENSEIQIDSEKGIAIINGQEIILDADSVFIIDEVESQPGGVYPGFYHQGSAAPRVRAFTLDKDPLVFRYMHRDSLPHRFDKSKMTDEQKAEWELYEQKLEEYGKQMEDWGKKWEESGEWREYEKQMEEYGKKWENSGEWKEYERKMEEWGKNWENSDEWKEYEKKIEDWGKQWEESGEWKEYQEKLKAWEEEHGDAWKVYGYNMDGYEKALADRELKAAQIQILTQEELARALAEHDVMESEDDRIALERALVLEGNRLGYLHPSRRALDPLDPIKESLENDGLIDADDNYSVILEADKLRINGKRMPDEVHQRYLELFQRTQGYAITGKSRFEISN
jgi:hypothetical protein